MKQIQCVLPMGSSVSTPMDPTFVYVRAISVIVSINIVIMNIKIRPFKL